LIGFSQVLVYATLTHHIFVRLFTEPCIDIIKNCSVSLEAAGAGIMQRRPVDQIGQHLVSSAGQLELLVKLIQQIQIGNDNAKLSGERMKYAAEQMFVAGNNLQGIEKLKQKGQSFLKGG
jgi:hypothetical protein